jgi:4-hydroxy-4-methyl-2-oxoglutarate aldolase
MNDLDRLAILDSCTVSDALDALGLHGAIFGLTPMTGPGRIVGRAQTVRLGPPLPDQPKRHLGAASIMMSDAESIIVVEHRGRIDVSGWGGLLSRGAVAKGVRGVIVDGACRDVDESRELGLAVFARGATPRTARGRVAELSHNEPITVGDSLVHPGDLIIADGSGVVFVPVARIDEILTLAEKIFQKEQLMARDVDAGVAIGDVMGANYEDMLKGAEHA